MRFAMLSNYMKTQADTGGGRNPSLSKTVSNNTNNPIPCRIVLLCATFSLLLGCMLVDYDLKPDDEAKPTDIQSELDQSRKKWVSQMVSDYQFNFRWICFCALESIAPVNITVRENRIDSAAFVADDVPVAIEGFKRYRTIEGLFDLLQEGIDRNAHSILAHYHSELGYPIDVWIDYDEATADEELGFEINSLLIE